MNAASPNGESRIPLIIAAALATGFALIFLAVEEQWEIGALLVFAVIAVVAASRFGWLQRAARSAAAHETLTGALAIAGVLVLTTFFREDHFALLLLATVLIYVVVCLGLTLQFGHAGVVNFCGAAFFGVGGYTAAVLAQHSALPHLLILLIGGALAALLGGVLTLPLLRTKGHYAALITIAFGILFRTFLEVNDVLGGPQGLKLPGFTLFGHQFNDNIELGESELSFYVNYVALALLLALAAFSIARRVERSWIGLSLDAVRLDETAAASFGIRAGAWKILAFTLGNFFAGVAGALFAMMLGFIAPNNFTFSDSLIMISIILLGGLGNFWGVALGAAIVLVLPEKLQIIQEYRFLLFSVLVIVVLLLRPQGLLPRAARRLPGTPL